MLNLFNNNYSLLDQNLLSYGLLLGSISIIGFSMYYFTGYLSNAYIHKTVNTIPNAETFNQRLIENLNNYQTLHLDNKVPTKSNFVESISQGTNTETRSLVDSSVQTDMKMLYDYMNELLYNNATPTTSLGEINTTDFIETYRNDPALASYFNKTAEWVDSISRQISGTSTNSEVLFLRKVNEDINSIRELIENNLSSINVNSNPVSPISNSSDHIGSISINLTKITESVGMSAEELNLSLIEYSQLQETIRQVYELGCF